MAKAGVIGSGSWGTALARVLSKNGHEVTLWSRREEESLMLREERENKSKLPGVKIPDDIICTTDLEQSVREKDILVLATASPSIRSMAKKMAPFVAEGQIIVDVSKGIEESTLMILTDVIEQEIPQCQAAVLSGPSHAEEVGRDIPTTVVAGAKKKETAEYIQNIFMNKVFRVYTSPDMLGIELGGALKNVIALAAGILDGMGLGDNTKAALMTRGIAEISRLGVELGGKMETFCGLSGIGDLIVTCISTHSRNHNCGYMLGQGKTLEEAKKEIKQVIEGVNCAKAAMALANKNHVTMPIVEQINAILFSDKTAEQAVADLLMRDKVSEYKSLTW